MPPREITPGVEILYSILLLGVKPPFLKVSNTGGQIFQFAKLISLLQNGEKIHSS